MGHSLQAMFAGLTSFLSEWSLLSHSNKKKGVSLIATEGPTGRQQTQKGDIQLPNTFAQSSFIAYSSCIGTSQTAKHIHADMQTTWKCALKEKAACPVTFCSTRSAQTCPIICRNPSQIEISCLHERNSLYHNPAHFWNQQMQVNWLLDLFVPARG